VVVVTVADALGALCDALAAKAEPLRDRAAAQVVGGGADLHALQAPGAERVADERADGARHRPLPLVVGGQPVADARRPPAPVDGVEADDAAQASVAVDDRQLQTVVVGRLAPRRADELQRRARVAVAGDPRHPRLEVGAVGVDEREQLGRVVVGQRAQAAAAREHEVERRRPHTFASNASSAA